jgi:ribosomal protein S18 acetylase RimI-like enzyme
MEIVFRQATDQDFEELLRLRIDAMRPNLERAHRFDPEAERARFRLGFSASQTQLIMQDNVRIGFVVVKVAVDNLSIAHLCIHPNYQNQGAGRAVLDILFRRADALNLPVRLQALRDSDANAFFSHLGLQRSGVSETDFYYRRPPPLAQVVSSAGATVTRSGATVAATALR